MFFKAKIDGIKKGFIIPDNPEQYWLNYHIVKHVILNDEYEELGKVLQISSDELNEMKSKLKDNFNCSVEHNISQKESCNKCTFTKDCRNLLEPPINRYSNYLRQSTREDDKDPTHAHYSREKTEY